ncbi:hypothetical protein QP324_05880, partial [Corynebacterium sp. UMB0012]|uniref:hypothetical protein n=1 Tax=Corynebacterium sp. UMB0012 TaxID=3046344 RepID=UPI00254C6874
RNRVLSHPAHQHRAVKEAELNPGRFKAPVIKSNKQVNPTRVSNNTVREVTSFARLYVIVAITPVKASVTLAFASEWRIHSFTNASVFHA